SRCIGARRRWSGNPYGGHDRTYCCVSFTVGCRSVLTLTNIFRGLPLLGPGGSLPGSQLDSGCSLPIRSRGEGTSPPPFASPVRIWVHFSHPPNHYPFGL